jgi:hypothetical protein
MNQRTRRLIAGISFVGLAEGGAGVVPSQLVEARAAFTASSNGLAGALSPTELHEAQQALDLATREFDAHGDTLAMRALASIAKLKAELADAFAMTGRSSRG